MPKKPQFDLMGDAYDRSLREFPGIRNAEKAFLIRSLRLAHRMRVLDLGAGSGFLTIDLANHVGDNGVVLAADPSTVMLSMLTQKARSAGLAMIKPLFASAANLSELLEKDYKGYFDRVVCLGAFHHVPDQVAMCQSIIRSLASGGFAIVADFADQSDAQRHFDGLVHQYNPTGHSGLFLTRSRAVNLVRYAEIRDFQVAEMRFPWTFRDAEAVGQFFSMHHGLSIGPEETRKIVLENFRPMVEEDGRITLWMDYVILQMGQS